MPLRLAERHAVHPAARRGDTPVRQRRKDARQADRPPARCRTHLALSRLTPILLPLLIVALLLVSLCVLCVRSSAPVTHLRPLEPKSR